MEPSPHRFTDPLVPGRAGAGVGLPGTGAAGSDSASHAPQVHRPAQPPAMGKAIPHPLRQSSGTGRLHRFDQGSRTASAVEEQIVAQPSVAKDIAALHELTTRALLAETPVAAAETLANRIADHLVHLAPTSETPPTVQIRIGLLEKKRGQIATVVGNGGDTELPSVDSADWQACMLECLARNQTTCHPPLATVAPGAALCHRQLGRAFPGGQTLSVPLRDPDGQVHAVMTVVSSQRLMPRQVRWLEACGMGLGAVIRLHAERPAPSLIGRWCHRTGWKPRRWTMAILVLALLAAWIPFPYRVGSTCTIQPLSKRIVAAPLDAPLLSCFVEVGEKVSQGQLLAQLDGRDLAMELAEVNAELQRAQKTLDVHLATHESGEARIVQHRIEQLMARQQLLLRNQERLQLVSPIDGILLSGDLQHAVGLPLRTGEVLFEVAPDQGSYLELAVPEAEIGFIRPGQTVRFTLAAYPFQRFQGVLQRIHPAATLQDDQQVFLARVPIDHLPSGVRPGMTGRAVVLTDPHPLWWNLLYRPLSQMVRWCGW